MAIPDPLALIPAKPAGDDFEAFFWELLRRRYAIQDLVYLPAELDGDYGLEGYSKDGIGYQCQGSPLNRSRLGP